MREASKEQIARELIAEIASEWEDTPEAFKSERDGRIIFTFVINQHNGSSVFYYDPQTEAEQAVEDSGSFFAGRVIRHMLAIAKQHFGNSHWQLREIASAQVSISDYEFFGMPDARKRRIEATMKLFAERLQEQLGGVKKGRNQKPGLSAHAICNTMLHFKEQPSQNKLAAVLKVSAKALREWRKERGFDTHEDFLKVFYDQRAGGEKLKPN